MHVLVTGGSGFVGSHLVDLLLQERHSVVVVDDFSTGHPRNLVQAPEVEIVEGSILDQPLMSSLVQDVDLVFHLAATVGVRHIIDRPLDALLVNTRGTDLLLELCADRSVPVVMSSTSEVNGKAARLPMHEDDDRVLGATSVSRWSYASAKALDEHLCLAYAAQGHAVSVVRYFNAYGPRLDPRGYGSVVAKFIGQALTGQPITVHGDGEQTRSFLYVEDTARGTYLAATTPAARGSVINIGGERETSMLDLAHIVREVVGSDSPIELVPHAEVYGPGFEDTRRRVPDITRAREMLHWEPSVALEDGLARTVEWWLRTYGRSTGGAPATGSSRAPQAPTSEAVERPAVAVMGLGYVGLPMALAYADAGFPTIGFDVDAERVASLANGHSHIEDVSDAVISDAVAAGRFDVTTDPEVLGRADCVFVCVPTPFDESRTPDLSAVRSAAETLAGVLRPGMLVVLQSTTFPGTTTEIVQPILEGSGLRAGIDFDLAFSPERVDPGNRTWTVSNTPKVVGAVTPTGAVRATALLEAMMGRPGAVHVVSNPAAAEMAKLLENTYRAVNIALVNELAMLAHEMQIDIWEVIDAAATKPFGYQPFRPGVGPGGHCIPVDPYYLSWKARAFDFQTKFIELAADVNLHMAEYLRNRISAFLNGFGQSLRGTRVHAVGVAFKGGVGDVRNSRAVRLLELLEQAGASVTFTDPFVATVLVNGRERKSVPLTDDAVTTADLAVLLVDHPGLDLEPLFSARVRIFDAVNATRNADVAAVERL
jgi:UDP-N-acetyl-D-glucosamine dehydrogenase